ncbi:MAG TPA: hypothetical protein VF717_02695 [Pyrinomonadaceae bacterium]|jgi:hypothetical protein
MGTMLLKRLNDESLWPVPSFSRSPRVLPGSMERPWGKLTQG